MHKSGLVLQLANQAGTEKRQMAILREKDKYKKYQLQVQEKERMADLRSDFQPELEDNYVQVLSQKEKAQLEDVQEDHSIYSYQNSLENLKDKKQLANINEKYKNLELQMEQAKVQQKMDQNIQCFQKLQQKQNKFYKQISKTYNSQVNKNSDMETIKKNTRKQIQGLKKQEDIQQLNLLTQSLWNTNQRKMTRIINRSSRQLHTSRRQCADGQEQYTTMKQKILVLEARVRKLED